MQPCGTGRTGSTCCLLRLVVSVLDANAGDEDVRWFSYDTRVHNPREQMMCYLTHTTAATHRLIQENLKETPIYGGWVDSKV